MGAVVVHDQTNILSPARIVIVFLGIATISLFGLIDETSLAVALPAISSDFNAGNEVTWIATGGFVTATAFQLIYGRLADIWSRKSVLLSAIAIFFMGSLGASLSQNLAQIVVSRAIAGMGTGGLLTVAQVIVTDVVSLRERGKYQGILGAAVALGNGIGPVIGGIFSDKASWRWIFRLNLILSSVSVIIVTLIIPAKPPKGEWKKKLRLVDYVGSMLIVATSALTVLSLTWGGARYPWGSLQTILPLVFGIISLVAFILWQWKGAILPSLPLYIFKQKMVCGACITHAINGWCAIVQFYYLPTFYQLFYGYSATKSGILLLPVVLVMTVVSTASGLVITWTGRYREIILFGWILWSIGLGLLSTLHTQSSVGKQVGYSLLTGIGIGQTFQPALIAVQAAVDRKDVSVTTGTRNLVRNFGGTVGLAVAGSILNNILSSRLADLPTIIKEQIIADPVSSLSMLDDSTSELLRSAYQSAFRTIFIISASLASAAFLVAFVLMDQVDLDAVDEQQRQKTDEQEVDTRDMVQSGDIPAVSHPSPLEAQKDCPSTSNTPVRPLTA
ncbi:hypothetical protein FRC02_007569 [Tulasnella sp. 418]|nr:hypothetical protein FRC02_007569 [Tulasnella sp. 418]